MQTCAETLTHMFCQRLYSDDREGNEYGMQVTIKIKIEVRFLQVQVSRNRLSLMLLTLVDNVKYKLLYKYKCSMKGVYS